MSKVNKVDFYCGAFLSYLISNGVEPTLFDVTENSKVIEFTVGKSDYKAYIKYVSTERKNTKGGKKFSNWSVIFSEKEKSFVLNDFEQKNKVNIVVLVCTNKNLKDTCFAVLNYDDAIKCIGHDDINGQARISVSHQKKSSDLYCHGTALSDENAVKTPFNADKYFGF